MTAILSDRFGFEVHRFKMHKSVEVIIWSETAYVFQRQLSGTTFVYLERTTHVVTDTPASGIHKRSDLNG